MQPHLGAVVTTNPTEADDQQSPPPRRLTLGPLNLGDWVNTTFTVCDQDLGMDELLSGLSPRDTATCYWVPSSSQLLIRSEHWRIDGSGMVMLGHEFLSALATVMERGPKLTLQYYLSVAPPQDRLLAPSLESIAQLLSQRPAIRQGGQDPAVEKAADALVADFLQAQPSIALHTLPNSEAAVPDRTEFAVGRLDAQATAQVLAGCKANSYTVTSAVHAAIVRVTATYPQHPLCNGSYARFSAFDLRPTISAAAASSSPLGTANVAAALPVCGLYLDGPPLRVENAAAKGFSETASQLCAIYRRDPAQFLKSKEEGENATISLLELEEALTRRVSAIVRAPAPKGWPPAQTPDLSSLGVIDSRIRPKYGAADAPSKVVQLKDFWIGTEMLGRNIQFHVWTWNSQLTLSVCFNQSYYEKQFVDRVVDTVLKELLETCHIGKRPHKSM